MRAREFIGEKEIVQDSWVKLVKNINETVNPEIFNIPDNAPGFKTELIEMGDFMFDARSFLGGYDGDESGLQIRAYDFKRPKGQQTIAHADFILQTNRKGNTWLESDDTWVHEDYRGRGVASTMYAFAKMLGNDIKPSSIQTISGRGMWRGWGKDAKNLVGENKKRRHKSKRRSTGRVYGPVPYMGGYFLGGGDGDSGGEG